MGLCRTQFAGDTTVVRPQAPERASFKLQLDFRLAVMSYGGNKREEVAKAK
jgi:hypothetical protein